MADFRTNGMGENLIARERQKFERAKQVCGLISKAVELTLSYNPST